MTRFPDDFEDQDEPEEACRDQIEVLARDLAFDEFDRPREEGGRPEATLVAVHRRAAAILHEIAQGIEREANRKEGP